MREKFQFHCQKEEKGNTSCFEHAHPGDEFIYYRTFTQKITIYSSGGHLLHKHTHTHT